jgi:hypothetical protein
MDTTPHVSNDRWYGHDRPDDKRYHMDHGFPHGRFERFGPGHRYNIVRIDHDHHCFWLPGRFFFDVAAWDSPMCADWCWDCGDDYVIYEDPDHIGRLVPALQRTDWSLRARDLSETAALYEEKAPLSY